MYTSLIFLIAKAVSVSGNDRERNEDNFCLLIRLKKNKKFKIFFMSIIKINLLHHVLHLQLPMIFEQLHYHYIINNHYLNQFFTKIETNLSSIDC